MSPRTFQEGDETSVTKLLEHSFGGLEYLSRVRAEMSRALETGFFAVQNDSDVGCIAVLRLPRDQSFEFRYLAVPGAASNADVTASLVSTALDYARSRNAVFVRGVTLSVPPYVQAFKRSKFAPARRILRFSWDLEKAASSSQENASVGITELSEGNRREAAEAFVKSLSPYWDWLVDEQGGPDAFQDIFLRRVEQRKETWLLAMEEQGIIGMAGLVADYYGPGEAGFRGAYSIPEWRLKGVGSKLMLEAVKRAKAMGQKRMTVHTVSDLDCFAPGALLYLRSGGTIKAEYLHLEQRL